MLEVEPRALVRCEIQASSDDGREPEVVHQADVDREVYGGTERRRSAEYPRGGQTQNRFAGLSLDAADTDSSPLWVAAGSPQGVEVEPCPSGAHCVKGGRHADDPIRPRSVAMRLGGCCETGCEDMARSTGWARPRLERSAFERCARGLVQGKSAASVTTRRRAEALVCGVIADHDVVLVSERLWSNAAGCAGLLLGVPLRWHQRWVCSGEPPCRVSSGRVVQRAPCERVARRVKVRGG